eukprot:scaffold31711_cov59-Phaeocystis_antarctica.AAC.2
MMVWSSFRDHAMRRGSCRFSSPCSADKEVPPGSLGLGPALASRFQWLRTASSERPGSRPAMARHFCPSSATPLPTGVGLGRGARAGARAGARGAWRVVYDVWRVVCDVWCVACGVWRLRISSSSSSVQPLRTSAAAAAGSGAACAVAAPRGVDTATR